MKTIKTKKDYHSAMAELEVYLQKGFAKFSKKEAEKLKELTAMIEKHESLNYVLPMQPGNITEMIELKMFEKKLKQKDLAKILGISDTRISEVLRGKRKVNLELAKKLHAKLGIDATFLLQAA